MREPAILFQENPKSRRIGPDSFFRKWTSVQKPQRPCPEAVTSFCPSISPKVRAYRLRRNGREVIEEPLKAELLEKVP